VTALATAFVEVRPDTKKFGSVLRTQVSKESVKAGAASVAGVRQGARSRLGGLTSMWGVAGKGMGVTLAAGAALGFAKSSVGLEAQFGKTMNLLQATTRAPAKDMKRLSDLALKMGKDTVFSANDASRAMLELARGGMNAATIQGGALQGTLTLAAAGELEMGEAANVAVKAMGAFQLKGKDMGGVAAALAGAANASSSSVRDLSFALAQGGLAAKTAGLSIQETTAMLAAFANQGLEGSDAGTSLKTFLSSLQPTSDKTTAAFKKLGLITKEGRNQFVKANGDFKGAAQIAGILQRATEKLGEAEKTRLLRAAFGSDAQRAAIALSNEGAKSVRRYVRATSDQGAAQRTANAAMKGTAGVIESLKGSWETLRLVSGKALAPLVQVGGRGLTKGLNAVTNLISGKGLGSGGGGQLTKTFGSLVSFGRKLLPTFEKLGDRFKSEILPALASLGGVVNNQLLPAFRDILPVVLPVAKFLLQMFGDALIGLVKGAIQAIKGFVNVIAGVFKLVSALIHGEWGKAWEAVKQILTGALNVVVGLIKVWFNFGIFAIFKNGVKRLLGSWKSLWSGLKSLGGKAMKGISSVIERSLGFILKLFVKGVKGYFGIWRRLFSTIWGIAVNGWRVLRSAFGGAFAAIKTVIVSAVKAYIGFWRGLFTRLRNLAVNGWTFVTKAFRTVFTTLKGVFARGVDAIGRIWSGIQSMAMKPVKFIIDVVYNNGIRKVINALPGVKNLPEIQFSAPPIRNEGTSSGGHGGGHTAVATGGVLPGWTPGRDVHRFYSKTGGTLDLSGGEAIMRPEWTRAVGGPLAVARMNKAARSGRFRKAGDVGAFAAGGTLSADAVMRAQQFARGQVGKPYIWGGVGPGGYDCSGFMSAITNVLTGRNPYGRVGSTSGFPWPGFAPGVGQFTIGSSPNYRSSGVGHMAGTLGGLNVESRGGAGPVTGIAARGYTDPGFSAIAHLGAGGAEAAKSGGLFAAVKAVKGLVSKVAGWLSELVSMGGWGGVIRDVVRGVLNGVKGWVNDKIPGPGPVPSFDQGGIARGRGSFLKDTARPERVLSPRQTEAFDRLVATLERGGLLGAGMYAGAHITTVDLPSFGRENERNLRKATVLARLP